MSIFSGDSKDREKSNKNKSAPKSVNVCAEYQEISTWETNTFNYYYYFVVRYLSVSSMKGKWAIFQFGIFRTVGD